MFVIGPGLPAFKTFAAALRMSFSSSSWRTRSLRLPSKLSWALFLESLVGMIGLLSAASGSSLSAALAQL